MAKVSFQRPSYWIGKIEIDHQDVRPSAGGLDEPVDPGGRLEQAIAQSHQAGPENASGLRVVLDDKDDRLSHFNDLVFRQLRRRQQPRTKICSNPWEQLLVDGVGDCRERVPELDDETVDPPRSSVT